MSPRPLEGRRVLLVDDDPDILGGMDLAFRGAGAATSLASDGESALAAITASAPDLVILDMMLPRASGLLVLERLRESARRPPVVMITANRGQRHQAFARDLGVEEYLVKPVPLARLLEVAERLIARTPPRADSP